MWEIARFLPAVTFFLPSIAELSFIEAARCAQTLSHVEPADRFAALTAEGSDHFGVLARWICSIMQIKSGGDTTAQTSKSLEAA